jgi:hypothetical protein
MRRAAVHPTSRLTRREAIPVTFTESSSKVGLFVILPILGLAAALLVFGSRVSPALLVRWPSAARVVEERADLFVGTGLAMLAGTVACLLLFLIMPA